ncbi:hypothetical protein PG989_012640 [Apiospora arundinis]
MMQCCEVFLGRVRRTIWHSNPSSTFPFVYATPSRQPLFRPIANPIDFTATCGGLTIIFKQPSGARRNRVRFNFHTLSHVEMFNLQLLTSLVAGALALAVIRILQCPLSGIPGPWYTRFTRVVLKFYILAGREMYYIHDLHQRYGPVVRISPTETAVTDLAAFNQIHRVGSTFIKGPWYDSSPIGIFAMRDPKQHAQRRRLFARAFSKTALRTNWEAEVRRTVERTVDRIKTDAQRESGSADIFKWWTLMATDIIAHLSFGESFDMVGLGRKTDYVSAMQNSMISSGLRWELPWLHAVARQVPLKTLQDFFRCNDIIMVHAEKAVLNLRQSGSGAQNLFGQMVDKSENEKGNGVVMGEGATHHLSDLNVRLEATNLIIAGSDTTAVTLTYLVWAVLKRPELQRRLEEEVAGLQASFAEIDVETLPLLNSVIDETLRLYGAAPGALPRYVPEGGATMGGPLPAGGNSGLYAGVHATSRRNHLPKP